VESHEAFHDMLEYIAKSDPDLISEHSAKNGEGQTNKGNGSEYPKTLRYGTFTFVEADLTITISFRPPSS
jgi:G:T/U-mismatch repair DNA glycosylase